MPKERGSVFERQSALATGVEQGGCVWADSRRALTLREIRGWTLVQVAGFSRTAGELEGTLRRVLGGDLPKNIGIVHHALGDRCIFKTAAAQYWIITREGQADTARELETAVPAHIGAVTSLSHSRACVSVEGANTPSLLATGIAIDLSPEVFRVDHFALTGVHHMPLLIHRSADVRYELYTMRTFAISCWAWLTGSR
jgi:sarcosine oxidase subunit gamma